MSSNRLLSGLNSSTLRLETTAEKDGISERDSEPPAMDQKMGQRNSLPDTEARCGFGFSPVDVKGDSGACKLKICACCLGSPPPVCWCWWWLCRAGKGSSELGESFCSRSHSTQFGLLNTGCE